MNSSMSSRKPKTKIVNGEVVTVDENDSSQLLLSSRTLDVFGFNLDLRQFFILLAILSFFLGPKGTIALLLALGAYSLFNRVMSGSIHPPSNISISGGGGNERRQAGSNIRGIKDLPCDPKVG